MMVVRSSGASVTTLNDRFRRDVAVRPTACERPLSTQSGPGLVFVIPGRRRIELVFMPQTGSSAR
jgi:hypothetical protein